jgi:hypothetical protein
VVDETLKPYRLFRGSHHEYKGCFWELFVDGRRAAVVL